MIFVYIFSLYKCIKKFLKEMLTPKCESATSVSRIHDVCFLNSFCYLSKIFYTQSTVLIHRDLPAYHPANSLNDLLVGKKQGPRDRCERKY